MTLKERIKSFLSGWQKVVIKHRIKTFWQYLLAYEINYMVAFGCPLFIFLFLKGYKKYDSPIPIILAFIPMIILVYHFVTEYQAYKESKVSGKLMAHIFFGACLLVLLTVIAMVIL